MLGCESKQRGLAGAKISKRSFTPKSLHGIENCRIMKNVFISKWLKEDSQMAISKLSPDGNSSSIVNQITRKLGLIYTYPLYTSLLLNIGGVEPILS